MAQNRGAVAAASEMSSLNSQLLFTVSLVDAGRGEGRDGGRVKRRGEELVIAPSGDKQGGGGGAQLVACSAHR